MFSSHTNKIYFGGTYNKLSTRRGVYLSQYKLFKEHGHGKNQVFYEIMQYPDWKLQLIEEYPCHSRAMLNARIQNWVNNNESLNRGPDFQVLPDLVHPDSVGAAPKKLKTIVHPKKENDEIDGSLFNKKDESKIDSTTSPNTDNYFSDESDQSDQSDE